MDDVAGSGAADVTAGGGGGGGTPPPAPAESPKSVVVGVTLTVEQYNVLLAKQKIADDAAAEQVRLKAEADQAALNAAKARGDAMEATRLLTEQHTTALNAANQRAAAAEQTTIQTERNALDAFVALTVSEALATRSILTSEHVGQLKTLLSGQVEAVRDTATGVVKVVKKGDPATEGSVHLAATLDSPAYQIFQSRKGNNPPPTPRPPTTLVNVQNPAPVPPLLTTNGDAPAYLRIGHR